MPTTSYDLGPRQRRYHHLLAGWFMRYELTLYTRAVLKELLFRNVAFIVQELCESRGGRPELSVLTSLLVSVDVKNY